MKNNRKRNVRRALVASVTAVALTTGAVAAPDNSSLLAAPQAEAAEPSPLFKALPLEVQQGIATLLGFTILAGIVGGLIKALAEGGLVGSLGGGNNSGNPGAGNGGTTQPQNNSYEAIGKQMLAKINRERRAKGLNELIWNDQMFREATAYSQKLGRENAFHHDTNGYYYWRMGENLAAGPNPRELADMWINEKYGPANKQGHYKALMWEKHRYAAIGIAKHPKWGYVATGLFADTPRPS